MKLTDSLPPLRPAGPLTGAQCRRHALATVAWSAAQSLRLLAAHHELTPEDTQLLAAIERWAAGELV